MADDRVKPLSLRELRDRGVSGSKGPRDAKSVLRATRAARQLEKQEADRIAALKEKQSTDSNQ